MGVRQSHPIPPAPPRAPPPQQDNDDDKDDQKCRACFFLFPAPTSASGSNPTRDLIGSPLPDTPVFERKKRETVKEALQHDKEIFLSKYGGLEKELFLSPNNGIYKANGRSNPGATDNDDEAKIYEGPDCEKLLHEKYELLEVIGVGSTSTVHRCVKKSNGEVFACKVIDCAMIEERFQGMMAQFQVEIEALRQLQHPGIIRLYDVYIPENKIFIVMENMEGGELFDYVVQKGTLTEDEAAKIVQKVTSALVFMHSKNICHRDLKPENLLLKQKPKGPNDDIDVKIIDFGLSKAMEEPIARTFLGTRGYLAPEMLQRRDYTRAVDTWALGIIVFVLLCGCLPFDDDSATVPSDDLVKAKFVLRFPRWAKNLSASAKDLLSHLLDVNPRTRYTAEQALHHPWVRGETAPKGNLLASPGRIKKSPMLVGSIGSARNGRYNNAGRKYAPDPNYTPPSTEKPPIRKGSL